MPRGHPTAFLAVGLGVFDASGPCSRECLVGASLHSLLSGWASLMRWGEWNWRKSPLSATSSLPTRRAKADHWDSSVYAMECALVFWGGGFSRGIWLTSLGGAARAGCTRNQHPRDLGRGRGVKPCLRPCFVSRGSNFASPGVPVSPSATCVQGSLTPCQGPAVSPRGVA